MFRTAAPKSASPYFLEFYLSFILSLVYDILSKANSLNFMQDYSNTKFKSFIDNFFFYLNNFDVYLSFLKAKSKIERFLKLYKK